MPQSSGLYGMRRLPSPMRASAPIVDDAGNAVDEDDAVPRVASPRPPPRTTSSPSRSHRPSAVAQRESSVKSEEEDHGPPDGDDGDAMSVDEAEDESFASGYDGGWVGEEIVIPTQRGSPGPELRYQRSFTKLGQRKPTPRRIILPNEGDLSAMAKTVYYEHDEDQVEAPSPSPKSRRRAVRAREREAAEPLSMRILYGLDGSHSEGEGQERDEQEQDDEENNDPDVSGYVYDGREPEGFQVLEEVTPNTSAEHEEYSEDEDEDEVDVPPTSAPPQRMNGVSHPDEGQDDEQSSRSPSQEEPVQPEASDTELDEHHENLASQNTLHRRFSPHHQGLHQVLPESHHMSSPLHSSTPRIAPRVVLQTATPVKVAVPSRPSQHVLPAGESTYRHEYLQPVSGEDDEDDDEEDEEDEDGDESLDPDVVRVSSSNPKVAAKAAAILRMVCIHRLPRGTLHSRGFRSSIIHTSWKMRTPVERDRHLDIGHLLVIVLVRPGPGLNLVCENTWEMSPCPTLWTKSRLS